MQSYKILQKRVFKLCISVNTRFSFQKLIKPRLFQILFPSSWLHFFIVIMMTLSSKWTSWPFVQDYCEQNTVTVYVDWLY